MSRLFETVKQIKPGGKVHVTYIFVVAQLNTPTMTAPLSCSPRYSFTRFLALVSIVCEEGGEDQWAPRVLRCQPNTGPTVRSTRSRTRRQHPQTVQKWKYIQSARICCAWLPYPPVLSVASTGDHSPVPIRSVYPGPGKKTNIISFNVVVGPPRSRLPL